MNKLHDFLNVAQGIRDAQPIEKLSSDTVMAKIIYRRAGYYLGAFLWHYLKMRPNAISLMGAALSLVLILISAISQSLLSLIVILFLIAVIDCADGALARYLKQAGSKGELADAIGGYIVIFSMPLITWFMMFNDLEYSNWLMMGIFSGVCVSIHFLGRSVYLKMMSADKVDSGKTVGGVSNIYKKINSFSGFCGFMFPIMILFYLFNLPLFPWIYACFYAIFIGAFGLLKGLKNVVS